MIERNNFSDSAANSSEFRTRSAANNNRIRIWLVDDSDNYRSLLAEYLGSEEGFECSRQFPSAEAVLEALAREEPPDAILLDIQMGGLSGLDAVRPIKSIAGSTHVLMLTSLSDSDAKSRALDDGASDFLLKSWEIGEIPKHIRQAVERPATVETSLTERGRMQEALDAEMAEPVLDIPSGQAVTLVKAGRCRGSRLRRGVSFLKEWLRR